MFLTTATRRMTNHEMAPRDVKGRAGKHKRVCSELGWNSTFCVASLLLLATCALSGALNESQLEIWIPDLLNDNEFQPAKKTRVTDILEYFYWYNHGPRINRLAWGYVDMTRPRGVIVAGPKNGELALWDPSKILAGDGYVHLHPPSPLLPDPLPRFFAIRHMPVGAYNSLVTPINVSYNIPYHGLLII